MIMIIDGVNAIEGNAKRVWQNDMLMDGKYVTEISWIVIEVIM